MTKLLNPILCLSAALLFAFTAVAPAAEPLQLDNETARINYSLGYQIGGDFRRQGVKMDADAVVRGIEDALSGADPLMPRQEMTSTLMELKRKVMAEQRVKRQNAELQFLEEGKRFMQANAAKPGVKTTRSGLQYRILEPGSGKMPKPTDEVTVHYKGTLVNGNEFDSSYQRGEPATFKLDNVIKGWTEGLQLIKEGGRIQLVIPPRLAYDDRGPMAHRTLIFDIELISAGGGKKAAAAPATDPATVR